MDNKNCPSCLQSIDSRAIKCSHCGSRQPDAPLMHRNVPGRLVGGVCAALAMQFGWDPTIIRVLMVTSVVVTGAMTFWAYALVWFMTPFESQGRAPATRLVDWASNLFGRSSSLPSSQA